MDNKPKIIKVFNKNKEYLSDSDTDQNIIQDTDTDQNIIQDTNKDILKKIVSISSKIFETQEIILEKINIFEEILKNIEKKNRINYKK